MSEIVATFKPFEENFDYETALTVLRSSLSGADDGELYLEKTRSETLSLEDSKLRNASYGSSEGFGLRAVSNERIGYAHSSQMSSQSLKRASETVKLAIEGTPFKSAPPQKRARALYTAEDPIGSMLFKNKKEILEEIDDFARTLDHRVVQVSASLNASLQEIFILRPEGTVFSDIRPMARVSINLIIDDNGRRESGSSGYGGRVLLNKLLLERAWKKNVREALRIAAVNLEARSCPAGVMNIVLGPGWPGVLLHEAVGHGLEADFNRKKSSVFTNLFGKKIASKDVTIIDDGTIKDRRGSVTIDDEGTPSKKNILIKEGILVGLMHDRQNARLMKTNPTGNGRRQNYQHAPMPRMTNTYMMQGAENPKNILKDLKDGLYATGFAGGQVDITNGKFVFSCTEAYRVKNGTVQEPVKGATLIGDGATAMKQILAVGNDLSLDPGIGNCGKSGQWVPVGVGQPTLMISGLTVGGNKQSG